MDELSEEQSEAIEGILQILYKGGDLASMLNIFSIACGAIIFDIQKQAGDKLAFIAYNLLAGNIAQALPSKKSLLDGVATHE
jgi:hypothetical protein